MEWSWLDNGVARCFLNVQTKFVFDPWIHLRTFRASVKITITSQSAWLQFTGTANVASFVLGWNLTNVFSKHFGNWAHSRRKNKGRKWLTWGLHFHGSNWLNALMGVGFCIHWIASQLLTIQTSGMRTISSRNRYSHNRKINFRFTWHLTKYH